MKSFEEIVEILKNNFSDTSIEPKSDVKFEPYIIIPPQEIDKVCLFLRDNSELYFDSLVNLSAVDDFNGQKIKDEQGNEIPFETFSNPIEFFIPRDPNLQIPPMILTNKTFHSLNLTTDLPISIHFEIKANFSYRFVYKFDKQSSFTNSIEVNNQSYFTFMIDNQQTVGHRTLILRFRRRRESRI